MTIQILPPQLANQIAAGEVVERPASVVKELIENSIDAGATRIDIDIERGGAKLIRIRDNGVGIKQAELSLALARHATSKISSLDDLESIMSLGFRGEALASISSVSRLTLTSRTAEQSEAWQAYAEGREQTVVVKPAAHPVGTTLEVLDLFYNTPARRKFMRTEKTEFAHIDEVVRRIALARFDIAITLNHNGKMVRQYRAASQDASRDRRLGAICGQAFLDNAFSIDWKHGDLALKGWVVDPLMTTALAEMQYCYVNGRMMRDKLINHAIKQACQEKLGAEKQPVFVLYLEIDPHQVDVNVHPAKHEVRFHQARLVHDFIYQGVRAVFESQHHLSLDENTTKPPTMSQHYPENRIAAGRNQFAISEAKPSHSIDQRDSIVNVKQDATSSVPIEHRPIFPSRAEMPGYHKQQGKLYQQLVETPPVLNGHENSFGRVLTILPPDIAILERNADIYVLSLSAAERRLKQALLSLERIEVKAQPLLIPLRLKVDSKEKAVLLKNRGLLQKIGIEIDVDAHQMTIRTVPLLLRKQNLQILIHELTRYLVQHDSVTGEEIASLISNHLVSEQEVWTISQAITLLTDLERLCPNLLKTPPDNLVQLVDLQSTIIALRNDKIE